MARLIALCILIGFFVNIVEATPKPKDNKEISFSLPPVGSQWNYKFDKQIICLKLIKKNIEKECKISYIYDITNKKPLLWEIVRESSTGIFTSNAPDTKFESMECLIKFPLLHKKRWPRTLNEQLADNQFKEFIGIEFVVTPYGQIKAAKIHEVSMPFGNGPLAVKNYIDYWYAPEIGLVKKTIKTGQFF